MCPRLKKSIACRWALEDRTFIVPAGSPFFPGDIFPRGNRNVQMVKAGINYRFNWGCYGYGY
jgi:hypothetical protein